MTPEIGLAFGKCSVFAKTTIGELILDYDNLGPDNVTYDKKPGTYRFSDHFFDVRNNVHIFVAKGDIL